MSTPTQCHYCNAKLSNHDRMVIRWEQKQAFCNHACAVKHDQREAARAARTAKLMLSGWLDKVRNVEAKEGRQ